MVDAFNRKFKRNCFWNISCLENTWKHFLSIDTVETTRIWSRRSKHNWLPSNTSFCGRIGRNIADLGRFTQNIIGFDRTQPNTFFLWSIRRFGRNIGNLGRSKTRLRFDHFDHSQTPQPVLYESTILKFVALSIIFCCCPGWGFQQLIRQKRSNEVRVLS